MRQSAAIISFSWLLKQADFLVWHNHDDCIVPLKLSVIVFVALFNPLSQGREISGQEHCLKEKTLQVPLILHRKEYMI